MSLHNNRTVANSQKQLVEGKGLFGSHTLGHSPLKEAHGHRGTLLLTCPCLVPILISPAPALFHQPSSTLQDHLPRDGTAPGDLGPPISVFSQENATQTCLQANHMEAVSQTRFLFPGTSEFVSR